MWRRCGGGVEEVWGGGILLGDGFPDALVIVRLKNWNGLMLR